MNTESIFELSPPEKLQLVEDLWDDLAAEPSDVPLHEWQTKELNRRRQNLINNPASALTWDDMKARIRKRCGC
jgi:putative addiction module component (TIGR02574 family)